MNIERPIVQVAIDVTTVDQALRIGEAAVRAGADWLEAGTPLIVFEGMRSIGALAQAFPGVPILADFKMLDGTAKYVHAAASQGAQLVTVSGLASDASVLAAIKAGLERGISVIADLYAAKDPPARARELAALGIDSVYVHLGSDERAHDPRRDPLARLSDVCAAVSIPVGVGTFSVEDGVRAFRSGACIAAVGMPLIASACPEEELREYISRARDACAF